MNIKRLATLLLAFVFALPQMMAQAPATNDINIKIGSIRLSPRSDTMYVNFKLLRNGTKTHMPLHQLRMQAAESGVAERFQPTIDTIVDIRDRHVMAENTSILLLIDRSQTITANKLVNQAEVVKTFIKTLPETKLYIAFMENGTVTRTQRLDSASYLNSIRHDFDEETRSGEKNLYRAILSKVQELSGERENCIPDVNTMDDFLDNDGPKIMFVFTDGLVKNEAGDYYCGNDYARYRLEYIQREDAVMAGSKQNIPIHCVYMGDPSLLDEDLRDELQAMCSHAPEGHERGKFYQTIVPDSLSSMMMGSIDSLADDYCLRMINPEGKQYTGSRINLGLAIVDGSGIAIASGSKDYARGSVQTPVTVRYQDTSWFSHLFLGLLLGLLLLAVTYLVLQFAVPYLRYREFRRKYVVPFHSGSGDVVDQKCYSCKEPFRDGDLVVRKCQHVTHLECWEENHDRCPEYGHGKEKCKDGIHYYNQVHRTDPKNATHFLPWILYGMAGGLLAWLAFRSLAETSLFTSLVQGLAEKLYPFQDGIDDDIVAAITAKVRGWLIGGTCLGFFIPLAFSWILDFRKKDTKVLLSILTRSLIGAVCGFVAFLLGIVIIILLGKQFNCWWIDWVPWLFFALAIAIVIWLRSEINLRSALLGATASVIFSFLIMYILTGPITSTFSYMLYAAGFGLSIAVVHYASEQYFLKISGPFKERDIAICKWMSVSGGYQTVSIGKLKTCVLYMHWDKNPNIPDRAVELRLENDRPFLTVVADGVTQEGRSMPKDTKVRLVHGMNFTIGDTTFTYIEKDK